jgi:carbon storage regulator
MLVLTRRIGEKIVIDGNIYLTVVGVQGNRVRLGVTAPPTLVVDRQEVNERRREWSAKPWRQKPTVIDCQKTPDRNSLLAEVAP